MSGCSIVSNTIVTRKFMMPATCYLRTLLRLFLSRNWAWGVVVLSFFIVLGLFTEDAVYVAVILFFAAIPVVLFHFFITRLTSPDARKLLQEHFVAVDIGGFVLQYADGRRYSYPWKSIVGCKEKKHYYLFRLQEKDTPFLYLPKEAFEDEECRLRFEKIVLSALQAKKN